MHSNGLGFNTIFLCIYQYLLLATQFAIEMGFNKTSLQTNSSQVVYDTWKENDCQPNYRQVFFHPYENIMLY